MRNTHPMVEAEDLVYYYATYDEDGRETGNKTALDGVKFTIAQGSFVAVLGHNGSGKSTLAKLMNGLYVPSHGKLLIEGMDTADDNLIWEIRRRAGMVFQNPDNQIIQNVVEEDVGFGPENLGVPTEEIFERVKDALTRTGMLEFAKSSPNRLSGGQKQRVAIAGILAMKPDCLILDEPTAMLDPQGRAEVLRTVWELNRKEGMTVILITHHMEEVVDADRILVMHEGKIVRDGTPEEIFEDVEGMKELKLDVPLPASLAYALIQDGVPFPKGILREEDFLRAFDEHKDYFSMKETASPLRLRKRPETEVLLQTEELCFSYDRDHPEKNPVLQDISLNLRQGEVLGILGHTGSGKSTLMQMLNGLLKPNSGRVLYQGKDIRDKDVKIGSLRQKVGLVFQYPEYQIFENTIMEDVCFGPKNLGLSKDEAKERAVTALQLVGIEPELYQTSPFDISGGQKRRVAIAGVLAMEPEVLILDEPTAGLDPQGREDLLDFLKSLRKKAGITIVLVSHNMDEIAEFADRLLVMEHGKIRYLASPREVFSHEEELKSLGLDLPKAYALAKRLKERGVPMEIMPLVEEELLLCLRKLRKEAP